VNIENVQIKQSRILELENQLILIYIKPRSSNKMHKVVIENFRNGDPNTIKSLEIMRNCAKKMKSSINSDVATIGEVMNENWQAQKDLHPLMTTPLIEKAESIAFKNNALGFKCNGAGGGGSITILSPIEKAYALQKKLRRNNFTILPCKFCFESVKSVEI
jgi:galactokinase/mevalonate kinase-like predicted kinase